MQQISIILLRVCVCLIFLLPLGFNLHENARAQTQSYCAREPQPVSTPLNDLGNQVYIRMDGQNTGFTGGLYPNGSNLRPPAHESAGLSISRQIVPLDANGRPDPNGKIVMLGIGMSNAWQAFNAFMKLAKSDPAVNPALVMVNGAQPGMTAEYWVDPNAETWAVVNQQLLNNNVTPQQVQVAWVKNTHVGPGPFPDKAQALQNDLEAIARNLKTLFPNIKIAYYSSRTNSYTYWEGLSPEPNAFETGFAVKWMIESQINGDPELNYDPARGPAVAPYLSWSAYLWADGPTPRSDGLTWLYNDMVPDCTHPSDNGEAKAAQMLMDFYKYDTTAGWFRGETVMEYRFYLPTIFHYLPSLLR
jgi:hypothetical protein